MKTCQKCQKEFEVAPEDLKFLQKVSPEFNSKKYLVPEPKLCPDCRQQRRLSWRNERKLYKRTCDLCHKESLSIYRKDNPFPVYCLECWWSDKWDPHQYAKDFDFSRSFFDQFKELHNTVPRMMVQQSQNENSEYTNNVSHLKNCYMLFSSDFDIDSYFGVWIEHCNDIIDSLILNKCQLTHEGIYSDKIFNSSFVVHSSECSDSAFLLDCKNCTNCFMCYGLRSKQYHIGNKEYSKDEYLAKMNAEPLSSYKNYEKYKQEFLEMIKNAPYLYMFRNGRIIDSTGDFLTDVKNCKECYEVVEGRDCKYVQGAYQIVDAYDSTAVLGELGYENCECVPMPNRSAFNMNCYTGNNIFYSDMCMNNNQNIFGCVSLKKSEYCILNKKYSPEEYQELVGKIIEHMQTTGEYGEFFPSKLSPFYYNESDAQDFFPLTKDQALEQKYTWLEKEQKDYLPQNFEIPDDIKDVQEDIMNQILACKECGKNYKIIAQEYVLYKKMGLPIPRLCFECRHGHRRAFRKEHKLYDRKCTKCGNNIQTNYSPDRPEKVYCESCYLKIIM